MTLPWSLAEREEIAIALEQGQSLRSIASYLGRSPSSVSREVKRNAPSLNRIKYRGNRAQRRTEDRSRRSHAKERLANPSVKAYVQYRLIHDGWTPENIAGRLSRDVPGLTTHYESIYLRIYSERRNLIPYLVRSHKKRHKRPSGRKSRVSKIPNRTDTAGRPPQAELRRQAGRWEADTVLSRESTVRAAVLVERKPRVFMVIRMKDKTASAMHGAAALALDNAEKIDKVVNKINATPMKCLGFKTPAEVFAECGGVVLAG